MSGATGPEAGIVNLWVVNMGVADATWGAELFQPLHEPASHYVEQFAGSHDYGERARFLKALMTLRDQRVEDLFGRERALLKSMIADSGMDEPSQEALMLVREGTRQRLEARDRILKDYDSEQRKYVERGKVRDSVRGTRFGTELLAHFQSSYKGAMQTIARLRELAQANPAWREDAFVEAESEWRSAIHERLQAVITSGAPSPIVPHSQTEALVRAAVPNP